MPVIDGFESWAVEFGLGLIFILLVYVLVKSAARQSWMFAISSIIGLSVCAAFILNRQLMITVGNGILGLLGY